MPLPYIGGCQCGQIRYEIQAEPLTLYVCHCTECQQQSSSAFGMSMSVPREAVKLLQATRLPISNQGHWMTQTGYNLSPTYEPKVLNHRQL
ncbi:MAG: GFA family protein [Cyanobacteria bacterium P01_H01_bin.105]